MATHLDTAWLKPAEVAAYFKVSPITIRSWAQKGIITASKTPGGHRRYSLEEVERLASRKTEIDISVPDSHQKSILIVDDDTQVAGMLGAQIQHHFSDIKILYATDGFEAGALVTQNMPDLIFLDIMMPGIKGDAICRYLKKNTYTSHIPVIGITGYSSNENMSLMQQAGVERIITKPFDMKEIIDIVQEKITCYSQTTDRMNKD
jgi:excisionase family DNA binding protein